MKNTSTNKKVQGLQISAPRMTWQAAFLLALTLSVPVGGGLWLVDMIY